MSLSRKILLPLLMSASLFACSTTTIQVSLPAKVKSETLQILPSAELVKLWTGQEQQVALYHPAKQATANLILLPGRQFIGTNGVSIIKGELNDFLARNQKNFANNSFNSVLPGCPMENCLDEKGSLWYAKDEIQQAQTVAHLLRFMQQKAKPFPNWLLATGAGINAAINSIRYLPGKFSGLVILASSIDDFDQDSNIEDNDLEQLDLPVLLIRFFNDACQQQTYDQDLSNPQATKVMAKQTLYWNKGKKINSKKQFQRCKNGLNQLAYTLEYDDLSKISSFIHQRDKNK